MTRSPGRKGAVAALSAVVMVPVLGFAGLAIDVTRLWMVNARLKTAIDAAALVAARQISLDATERDGQAQAVYWMNFTQNGRTPNYMGSTLQDLQVATIPGNTNRISVSGSARVRTTLFSLISDQTTQVGDSSSAEVLGNGVEIALVMDQTESFGFPAPGFATKLQAAQQAAGTLLNILYGSRDTQPNVFVSVVPYSTTINIGTHNTALLNTANMPTGWDINSWYGCVGARLNGDDDIRDLGPGDTGGRLRPYFGQSTFRRFGWHGNKPSNTIVNLPRNATAWRNATGWDPYDGENACSKNNSYSEIDIDLYEKDNSPNTKRFSVRFCFGDNDWTNTRLASAGHPSFNFFVSQGFGGIGDTPEHAAGPNRFCALTSMLPLTASRATVQARIDAIRVPPLSGGTNIVTGMQGAWYALSRKRRFRALVAAA